MVVSDCHIHLGRLPAINRELTEPDVSRLYKTKRLDKMLILQTHQDHNVQKLFKFVSNYPGLYGLQWITQNTHPNDLFINDKIIGCKFHGAYNFNPRPKGVVLSHLNKLESILMFHTGRFRDGNIESNTSYLHALEVAKYHPYIKLIMAHMGGTDTEICKKAITAAIDLPNVYFDTSGITTPFIVEYAVEKIGSKRILFGSDVPWCSWDAMYWTVQEARITVEEKEDIYSRNFNILLT